MAAEAGAAEQESEIYAMVSELVPHYRVPETAPKIKPVPVATLREMHCPGQNCNIQGLHDGDTVYVRDDLDFSRPRDAAVLLHELIHYLQWANRGHVRDCFDWLAREQEAYLIQARVLDRAGEHDLALLARRTLVTFHCGG